jgi:nicotinamide phosphoribosyltransferase
VDGSLREVYKQPVTDAQKISKRGRLDLIKSATGFETVKIESLDQVAKDDSAMRTVFENGELLVDDTLDAIRERALISFNAVKSA